MNAYAIWFVVVAALLSGGIIWIKTRTTRDRWFGLIPVGIAAFTLLVMLFVAYAPQSLGQPREGDHVALNPKLGPAPAVSPAEEKPPSPPFTRPRTFTVKLPTKKPQWVTTDLLLKRGYGYEVTSDFNPSAFHFWAKFKETKVEIKGTPIFRLGLAPMPEREFSFPDAGASLRRTGTVFPTAPRDGYLMYLAHCDQCPETEWSFTVQPGRPRAELAHRFDGVIKSD